MTEHGFLPYDLAGNWCEECGRPKMSRLFGTLTGCKTCDEAVTRHRCVKRPAEPGDRELGAEWECPDCGTAWVVAEELDPCPECGRGDMVKTWNVLRPGDRIDTAPRHKPQPWSPLRNPFAGVSVRAVSPPNSCYRTPGGSMVHVKPGCRC